MFCMGGILNVGQCGSSQPGMTHIMANHGLDLLQNIAIWWFNMFFHHKKVIPDWDGPPHPSLGWQSGACHVTVGCVGWIIKKYHFCPQSQKPIPVWDELDFTFVAWLQFFISAYFRGNSVWTCHAHTRHTPGTHHAHAGQAPHHACGMHMPCTHWPCTHHVTAHQAMVGLCNSGNVGLSITL